MTENGNTAGNAPFTISVEEAAVLLGIGRGLAYQLVQEKKLPSFRLGRCIKISRQHLEAWIAQQVGDNGADGIESGQMPTVGAKEV